ncbi:MAG: 4-aminobutyrate aminotransferase [Verrucomicrobiales bacterium]|jgi:4-aminobutyrate aminotransferase
MFQSEGESNLSSQRESWNSAHLDAETRELLAEDAKYFLHQSLSTPCLTALAQTRGSYLTDLQGKRYLDFHGNAVHQVGYGHPDVIAAIKQQLDSMPFCPRRFTNAPAVALAKRLTELAPGDLNKLLFTPGGTGAIGMALKLARAVTGKFKTISLWESFHGASLDAISVGGEALFRKGAGPLLPGCEHVPPPDPLEGPWPEMEADQWADMSARYIEYVLEREGGDVGAVIAETIRWTPFVPPVSYWKKIRAACDKHGALLILDEIPSGLGRSGKMFVCEHYDIVPDILVIGKGLGGGVFPLAAILTREAYDVAADQALGHYTHEKNPVACAAGLATLDIIDKEQLLENTNTLGEYTRQRLESLKSAIPLISEIRGIGLIFGIVLRRADGSRAESEAEQMLYQSLANGLSFKITMGSILTLTPPLTVSRAELDEALEILEQAFKQLSPVEIR